MHPLHIVVLSTKLNKRWPLVKQAFGHDAELLWSELFRREAIRRGEPTPGLSASMVLGRHTDAVLVARNLANRDNPLFSDGAQVVQLLLDAMAKHNRCIPIVLAHEWRENVHIADCRRLDGKIYGPVLWEALPTSPVIFELVEELRRQPAFGQAS